jgi:hypothetical protein
MAYATLTDLKRVLGITDTLDDVLLTLALNAASAALENHFGRVFSKSIDETRYFTARDDDLIFVDDLVSVDSLACDTDGDGVYETVWETTNYTLMPVNAPAEGLPYRSIKTKPLGTYRFPVWLDAGVKLTGAYGYPAVPVEVNQATLLQAARFFRRKDAIFGVVGGGELGQAVQIAKIDPDIVLMLGTKHTPLY